MLDRRDPEFHEIWRARYDEACRQYTAREITQAVFTATLHGLGFTPTQQQSEINLHYPPSPWRPT